MKKIQFPIVLVVLVGFILVCGKKEDKKVEVKQPEPTPAVKEAVFPYFKVDVHLTPAALKKVKSTKSKIVVSFEFGTELGPDSANMISDTLELTKPDLFATDILNITPEQVDKLGTVYDVNVSVYSKGKAKDLNFLDCPPIHDKITNLLGGVQEIKCDLLKLK
jgi:hypothetical protein